MPKKPSNKNNKNKKEIKNTKIVFSDSDSDSDSTSNSSSKSSSSSKTENLNNEELDRELDLYFNKNTKNTKNTKRNREETPKTTTPQKKDEPENKKQKMEILFIYPNLPNKKTWTNPSDDSLESILRRLNKDKDQDKDNKTIKRNFVCKNKNCNHIPNNENIANNIPKIDYISNLSQLIELGKSFHCKTNLMYSNINLRVLHDLVDPLEELQLMIGLTEVKDKIVDQLLYFLQGYHNNEKKCNDCIDCDLGITCLKNQSDMLHTCICGPPGVGKTELGRVFGKIYRKLGVLSNDTFKIYTRSDLVGEYLGQTAIKTQKCIDECKGGVMFIDEAYSLGNEEKRDSFSKECIDTINQNLSEKRDFLCIIAGYKDSLEKCFFKYNDGLNRRFTFRYNIEPYKWEELKKIFELKVEKGGFKVYYDKTNDKDSENVKVQELFKKYKDNFKNSGGDMETLFLKSKIIHSRTISNNISQKYILLYDDIKKGMECLIHSRENLQVEYKPPFGMYL